MNNWKADAQFSDHDTKARAIPVSECLRHAMAGGLRPLGFLCPLCFLLRLWQYKIASSFSSVCLLSLKANLGSTGILFAGLRLKSWKMASVPQSSESNWLVEWGIWEQKSALDKQLLHSSSQDSERHPQGREQTSLLFNTAGNESLRSQGIFL